MDPLLLWSSLNCSPYHANTPLYPVVRHVLRRAGINADDTRETRRLKLARFMADTGPAGQNCPALDPTYLSLLDELTGAEPNEATGPPAIRSLNANS